MTWVCMQGLRPLPSLKEQREQRLQAQPLPPPHAQPVPPPATSVAGPQLFHYPFRERLLRGVILRRRARFTLEVDVDGETLLCYCPSTSMSLGGTRLDGSQARTALARFLHDAAYSLCNFGLFHEPSQCPTPGAVSSKLE